MRISGQLRSGEFPEDANHGASTEKPGGTPRPSNLLTLKEVMPHEDHSPVGDPIPASSEAANVDSLTPKRVGLAPRPSATNIPYTDGEKEPETLAEKRRRASLSRKVNGAGPGRPQSKKKRCPCEANTMNRAKARRFSCCRKAGVLTVAQAENLRQPKKNSRLSSVLTKLPISPGSA
jgi:hypothetical protein